jgi:putative NIF3 family GTP cyclohydrolase 1 type 2
MTSLSAIASFLNEFFQTKRYSQENNGILRPTERPIERIGLALEPFPAMASWVELAGLDALMLHRAAKLDPDTLPQSVGILGYHLPFDETLTLGWNLRLADVLGLTALEVMGWKQGRPLGMIGNVAPRTTEDYYQRVCDVFGGYEESQPCERSDIRRVAVVGAMTEALVKEASECGADLYITGQMRQPGRAAMQDTGIGVIAIGHRRSELWGLRALGHVLQERFADLECILPKPD